MTGWLRKWWRGDFVEYTPEEMRRFRAEAPDLDDLPDEAVQGLMVFQWWLFAEAVKTLGRELAKTARLPSRRMEK